MNEATALAEAKQASTLDRRGEAGHPDKQPFRREVHDLEPIQPFERLDGNPALHADTRCEICQVNIDTAGVFLDHPTEPSGQKRGSRTEVLRPHILDVSIAQSPSIIGLRRDWNYAEDGGLSDVVHTSVKASNQTERDHFATESHRP
ncbi:MAG: hypothetical protein ABJH68_20740 [Ilumatobacter sp.]|uniref:hypothetical protein n=1 Tax=Ilumatobacter sp. TaxID=1967498 RepID=UPI0032991662